MKKKRSALFTSLLALLLCVSMLMGTTLAWFTDSVSSQNNQILAGSLDVELEQFVDGKWVSVNESTNVFEKDALWEPGRTEVVYLRVRNAGDLALKYGFGVNVASETGSVNVLGNEFKLSDHIRYGIVLSDSLATYADRASARAALQVSQLINQAYTSDAGSLLPAGEKYVTLVVYMPEEVGNEANYATGAAIPTVNLGLRLMATQEVHESDSFGSDYDASAEIPGFDFPDTNVSDSASTKVDTDGAGKVSEAVTMQGSQTAAEVPAGVQLEGGATELKLTVNDVDQSQANLTLGDNESQRSVDVHIEGVAADNTVPMTITLRELAPKGLNMGNYKLYHVEDGVAVEMSYVASDAAFSAHNQFKYDPATGDVVLHMATFSEVAVVAETDNAWEGKFDYTWYTNAVAPIDGEAVTEYTIANADQLAAFGAIVGGMKKVTGITENGSYTYSDEAIQNSFAGKTVKLTSDINLGDDEEHNNSKLIFYPIGYWNNEGTYERLPAELRENAVSSSLKNFCGTFDGQGHTVSNFYQNTWEMKGDHDWYNTITEQYYRDGMGLFGRVYGGTVKNLTVSNFSSDGEIATTGVIAAYADFGATFENIAITNCNPRVYNIGNGGIVGCVGWYTKGETDKKVTFKNITVDNSNKISALWGSYDVACGGIVGQYYPTSGQTVDGAKPVNAGIDLVNCHVAAQMDVYNDVCANYQYYAYRYTGMLIGSIRENETINGHVYPKMDGITAKDCTVHFGTWNDYYYCEIIDNTTASYTHDYQMSRLTEIKAIDGTTITYLDGTTGTVPASGRANYVIVDYTKGHGTENATCYHFKDGAVWTHDMGGIQTGIDENGDGQDDLKEDKQHIYLEFNQLFTGYGWGVTSKGLTDFVGVENMDITAGDQEESVVKFESTTKELPNGQKIKIGNIFKFQNNGVQVNPAALTVAVTNVDATNPVSAVFDRDEKNWENSTIEFVGSGDVVITIQDYYFCTPTKIAVSVLPVTDVKPIERFAVAFPNANDVNRVGNIGTVELGKLFTANEDIGDEVTITFETVIGASVDQDTINATKDDWSTQKVQFSGTGIIKVTISDNNFSKQVTQCLEVVDAYNATGAISASDPGDPEIPSNYVSNNVVLLNNIGSGFTVADNYTVYGNGFTLKYTADGRYLNNGLKKGVVTVKENGTLDNLRIEASIYPVPYMYYGETIKGDYVQGGPKEVDGDRNRYYYQLSATAASGNATITNCYIYGGRTNIFVDMGNVTVKDTILECGTVANLQIQSSNLYTLTLENVTTIQHRVNPTVGDTSLVMLGAGVLVGPDTETNPTIVLNGHFKQYNWVTEEDSTEMSNETAKEIVDAALAMTAFNHTINGKTAVNLGIIYMNTAGFDVINNTGLPYERADVSLSGAKGKVYSLQKATADQIYSDYINADDSTVNGDYMPRFEFDLGEQAISYDGSEDTRYLYGDKVGVTALYQDGDDALTLDLTKLATIYKYDGMLYAVTATCKGPDGNVVASNNGVVTLSVGGSYTLVFTVEDNVFYNANGETIEKSVERTFTVPLTLTVKEANIKNAVVNITKTALDGVYNTVNLNDYELRIKFLDCISVTDYDNKGKETTVNLSSNIASATLTPSGANVFNTAFTITITYTDGRVLTVNFSKISGSSPGTKTAKVNTSGSVYFTTEGALNNKPTEASSQNKCTITSVSYKGNSGSVVTNDTDVTVTWALGSSGGSSPCVTSDTLVTLADGTQKRIDQVAYTDQLLVWDFYKGAYATVPAAIIFDHGYDNNTVIKLNFSDGTTVKAVNLHQFFDADLNQLVSIDANTVADYVGHKFVKQNGKGYKTVTLVDYTITEEYCEAWGIISAEHYNIFVEGMLSADFMLEDYELFNYFEVGKNLKFDEKKMQADIAKYGLYTYEDFAEYLTYEQFVAFNVQYFKIPVGKGEYTYEGILKLIDTYLNAN